MPEIFESRDFDRSTRLTVVQIIDHVVAAIEVNEMQVKFITDGINV